MVSAVVLLSAANNGSPGASWPDGDDSGDALHVDAAGRYLQLPEVNPASAQSFLRSRNRCNRASGAAPAGRWWVAVPSYYPHQKPSVVDVPRAGSRYVPSSPSPGW